MKLKVIQPKIKTNPNILYLNKPYYSNWSVTVVIKGLSIIHLVVKNKEGEGRGGLFEREGLVYMMFTLYLTRANRWRSFSVFSKVVSVDHNKPIIVPVGQDSFQQIGERRDGRLLV